MNKNSAVTFMLETIFLCSHLRIDVYIYIYKSIVPLMETNGVAVLKNWNKETDTWALKF